MGPGRSRAIPITFQQDRTDLPNLTVPIPPICHFEAILDRSGSTFLPKWLRLRCRDLQNIDSVRERRRNAQITLFQHTCKKTEIADPRLKPKPFPHSSRASPAAPRSLKVLPNSAQGRHISVLFGTSCTTWAHHLSRLLLTTTFQFKTTLQTTKTMNIYAL